MDNSERARAIREAVKLIPGKEFESTLFGGPMPNGDSRKYPFEQQIIYIMHALGDLKPAKYSARVMHEILQDQMVELIGELHEIVHNLDGDHDRNIRISHEEILFLMRHNKVKLKRLLKYLQVKDMSPSYLNYWKSQDDDDEVDPTMMMRPHLKRVGACMRFLGGIERFFEFTSILDDDSIEDEGLKRRFERRTVLVHLMTQDEYKKYSERISQASFFPQHKKTKFNDWLKELTYNFEFSDLALTMLEFLARETVAEIVDMAFYLREIYRENNNVFNDKPRFANIIVNEIRPVETPETAESKLFYLGALKSEEIVRAYNQFQIRHRPILYFDDERPKMKTTLLCLANAADHRPKCKKKLT